MNKNKGGEKTGTISIYFLLALQSHVSYSTARVENAQLQPSDELIWDFELV
jgi:hypothetical protein